MASATRQTPDQRACRVEARCVDAHQRQRRFQHVVARDRELGRSHDQREVARMPPRAPEQHHARARGRLPADP
jgi:hypothetical protein